MKLSLMHIECWPFKPADIFLKIYVETACLALTPIPGTSIQERR